MGIFVAGHHRFSFQCLSGPIVMPTPSLATFVTKLGIQINANPDQGGGHFDRMQTT